MKSYMKKLIVGSVASVLGTAAMIALAVLLSGNCGGIEYVETPEAFGGDICFIVCDEIENTTEYYTLDANRHRIAAIPEFEGGAQIYVALTDSFDYDLINGKLVNYVVHRKLRNLQGEFVEDIENREVIDRIFDRVAEIEHDILRMTIIAVDELYFVQVDLNVNWQSPCEVYYYNQSKDALEYLYQFQHKDVIGAKMLNADAFE